MGAHTDPTSPADGPADGRADSSPRTVDSVLGDAVTVLRAFAADDTHLTVGEIVRRSQLSACVVQETVDALVTAQLLEPTGTNFRLSTLLFDSACGRRRSAG